MGGTTSTWRVGYINTINTTAVVNSGTLDVSGTTNLGTATSGTKIVLGNSNMVSSASNPSYLLQGGKSAILTIGRCSDNSMTEPQLVIQGKTTANDGVKTNDLLQVFRISGNNPDAIRYFGRTSSGNDIQTKASADSTYARLAVANTFTNTNAFESITTLEGATTVEGAFDTSGTVIFAHSGATSSVDWKIQGKTTAAPSSVTGSLLSVFRPSSNSPDAISYNGTTTGDSHIQTKASVQALIDAGQTGNTDWISFKGSLTGYASSSVAEYRLVDGGKSCQIRISINQGGTSFGPSTTLFVGNLPAEAKPKYSGLFADARKVLDTEKGRVVLVAATGSVTIEAMPSNGQTTQDLFANFMYPTI